MIPNRSSGESSSSRAVIVLSSVVLPALVAPTVTILSWRWIALSMVESWAGPSTKSASGRTARQCMRIENVGPSDAGGRQAENRAPLGRIRLRKGSSRSIALPTLAASRRIPASTRCGCSAMPSTRMPPVPRSAPTDCAASRCFWCCASAAMAPATVRKRALAQIALYGGSATNPAQRLAAAVFRTAAGCRQTAQGCGHRRNAKVARCCVECGDSPETLRADNAGPGRDLTPPFGKGYKNLSVKSSGPLTQAG
jgi:hypothetical protein